MIPVGCDPEPTAVLPPLVEADATEPIHTHPTSTTQPLNQPPTPIGEPSSPIEEWPSIPCPPNLLLTAERTASHAAPAEQLVEWFSDRAHASGWLVLPGASRLEALHRLQLARGTDRIVLVIESHDEGSQLRWSVQADRPAVTSVPDPDDAHSCLAALPPTEVPEQPNCLQPAHQGPELAVGTEGLVLRGERRGEPIETLVTDEAEAPQLMPGVNGGWLASWLDPIDGTRHARHFGAGLRPTHRRIALSDEAGLPGPIGWAPVVVDRRPEYATALTLRVDERVVFQIGGVKRDGTRMRRSGWFPPTGAEPTANPVLASDGGEGLAMAWSSADGVFFRAVGTDGLPDDSEQRISTDPARALFIEWAWDSFWVVAADEAGGRWWRVSADGCRDDAWGELEAAPTATWTEDSAGALVLSGETVWRLGDPAALHCE